MSDFFAKKNCDRCGSFELRIMSRMNTDTICTQCEEEEKAS